MADENLDANLNLNAIDNASSVVKSATQRMRESLKEYERAVKDLRKSEADAHADGLREIELRKRAQDAWNKLQMAQSAKLAEDTTKHNERIRREAEKTGKAQKQAAAEAAGAYQTAGGALMKYAAGFASVGAAISGVQKGFMAFADHERRLVTMRTNMRLTQEQTESWAKSSQSLSAKTGLSIEDLTESLARYRSQSKQTFEEDVKSHEQLAQAAANSGTNIQDWEKIRSAANRAMRDDIKAVPGLIDGWRATVPAQMVAPFAEGLTKITNDIENAGGKIGPEFAHQLGGAFKAAEGMLETPQKSAQGLVELFAAATDNGTNFGKIMEATYKKLMSGEIDLVQFLARAQKEAEGQLVNAPGRTGESARARMGLTEAAAKVLKLDLRQVGEEADRSKTKIGGVAKETEELGKGPLGAVNRLSASYEGLKVSVGGAIDAAGGTSTMQAMSQAIEKYTQLQTVLNKFGVTAPLALPFLPGSLARGAINSAFGKATAPADGAAPKGPVKPGTRGVTGNFATGGEFVVPGSGGTDTTPVDIMATPGEKISIDPQGGRKEDLKVQQDKADQSLREHFARFRSNDRARVASLSGDVGGMYDSKGNYTGKGGPGGGGGGGGGGDPAGGTRTGTGTGGGGQASGTGPAGVDDGLKSPVGVDPASATGPAESLEEAYKRGYLTAPSSGGLAGMRAGFAAELKANPQLQQRFLASVEAEVGGQGAAAKQAFMETVFNRAANRGMNLSDAIHDKSFFPSMTLNKLGRTFSGQTLTQLQKAQSDSLGGSDITGGATGNYSVDRGRGWGPSRVGDTGVPGLSGGQTTYVTGRGEYLGKEGVDLKLGWEKKYQAALKSTGQNPSAPPGTTTGDLKKQLEGGGGSAALDDALKIEGLHEVRDREAVKAYLNGWDPVGRDNAWCARFINSALQHTGGKGTGSELAASFKNWGEGVKGAPQAGDVMVVGDHHVGFATGKTRTINGQLQYEMYSGNAGDMAKRDWRPASGLTVRRGTEKELGKAATTQVAGPTQISDVETRAGARYRTAQDRTAAAPVSPSFSQRARAGRAAMPKALPPAPVKRMPSAPGQEERAAGKGRRTAPAPVARAVSPEGHEDTASGKGPRPAPVEGKAAGGPIDADTPYMVGENGPEMVVPSSSGNVMSNSALQAMRAQMERPIEPIIRPRFQHMGASSARWTRAAERSRDQDNTRRAARESHTDLGFA